ncbi:ArsR/SmtB family transcription factor [Nocardioides sp. DS6]|uniref:ArsR/SmtB family transcription factor n=1 Tax=Nocardioides eburneus TaxID=3231482 RepID=A0ABV3T050_9ACTN
MWRQSATLLQHAGIYLHNPLVDADKVFKALADPVRRRLLDMLHDRAGLTLGELCEELEIRRQSVSQHLELLAAAGLVTSVPDGRRKLHYLNPVPIHQIQTRWIWKFEESHLAMLEAIKNRAEENAMAGSSAARTVPDYVYTTYIRATAEQVWEALTDADITAKFWGHAQVSEWRVGGRVAHVRVDGSGIADAAGTVVEVDRPRRLSFGFDEPNRADDPTSEQSLVTLEIEPYRDIVKLTLTQSRLRSLADREAIGQGWPTVLANLKTLLETGDVLPTPPWEFHAGERTA